MNRNEDLALAASIATLISSFDPWLFFYEFKADFIRLLKFDFIRGWGMDIYP
jgi:hypothetical protein